MKNIYSHNSLNLRVETKGSTPVLVKGSTPGTFKGYPEPSPELDQAIKNLIESSKKLGLIASVTFDIK